MAEFPLEALITAWREELRRTGIGEPALRELEDHLRTGIDRAVDAGVPLAAAFHATRSNLGDATALAREFHKESTMHPIHKFLGLAIAFGVIFGVIVLEGGHPIVFAQLPPLLLILGVAFGGLVAAHGPRQVGRLLACAIGGRRADPEEARELRWISRRGYRLTYSAACLQVILATCQVLSTLDTPEQIGPRIAYALAGIVHAVLIAELGFATMERWLGKPDALAAE